MRVSKYPHPIMYIFVYFILFFVSVDENFSICHVVIVFFFYPTFFFGCVYVWTDNKSCGILFRLFYIQYYAPLRFTCVCGIVCFFSIDFVSNVTSSFIVFFFFFYFFNVKCWIRMLHINLYKRTDIISEWSDIYHSMIN